MMKTVARLSESIIRKMPQTRKLGLDLPRFADSNDTLNDSIG